MSDGDLMRQPLAAIRAVQNQKIARQIALCARGSAFYQKHWSAAGIDAGAVHTLADLEHLPLTPKSALMADPEAFRLHCPDLPLHERAFSIPDCRPQGVRCLRWRRARPSASRAP